MIKKILKSSAALILAVIMAVSAATAAFAATPVIGNSETSSGTVSSGLVITSYRVLGHRGSTQINKGETVDIEVTCKCTGIRTDKVNSIDAVKLVDSFSGTGNAVAEILTSGSSPLEFALTFRSVTYSGTGNTLRFNVGYKGDELELPYESTEVVISECKPYEEKQQTEKPAADIPSPFIILSRGDMDPVAAKKDAVVTVNIKNVGTATMKSPVATFSVSDGLMLNGNSSSIQLSDIPSGAVQTVNVPVRGASEITSANQYISVEMKFLYDTGNATAQGTASDKVVVPVTTTGGASADNPSPNIIITNFGYGGNAVEAGGKFTLSLDFMNTSLYSTVENVVMTVETGENFTIDSATNTYFYRKLPAGGTLTEKVAMQALPGAKTGAQSLEISFKYEYVDNNKRSSSNMSEKISIPVFQKDRFEVTAAGLPTTANAGEELTLSLSYVNKGKSEVSNVEASVVGDVKTMAKVQNLGNFESGKSGTIGFVVTPEKAGKLDFKLRVAYEDANQQQKEKIFDVSLDVQEPVAPPETDMPVEEEPQSGGTVYWIVGAVLVVAAAALFIVKRRRKKALNEVQDFSWDDDAAALDSGDGQKNAIETQTPPERGKDR